MVYSIMWRDTHVGDVYTDDHNRVVSYSKLVPDGMQQPFGGPPVTTARFFEWLESRCYENGRPDLKHILSMVGMTENNPYEWNRMTHGVTYDDFFWIRYPGEKISWKDVKVR